MPKGGSLVKKKKEKKDSNSTHNSAPFNNFSHASK